MIIQNLLSIKSSHFNEKYRIFWIDFLKIQVILTVLSNQLLVAFPFTVIGFWLAKAMDNLPPVKTLPNFSTVVVDFIVFVIVEEIAFYYSHRWIHICKLWIHFFRIRIFTLFNRLLHCRYFYKAIHKKHHEWTSPIAITASYCHPIEHFLSNTIPPVLVSYPLHIYLNKYYTI